MILDVPPIWLLIAFDALFLGVFVYRRMTDRPRPPGALSFVAQSSFIAINCLILFPDEVSYYLGQLRRLF